MEQNILVIGIAGGTGSGKSTLVKNLVAALGDAVTVLSHDNYYRRLDHLSMDERKKINYDEPAALETELMVAHLQALRSGFAIECPVYDFSQHNRGNQTTHIVPKRVIIVEGILIFANEDLRNLMDIRIFVDTDADTRVCRRIKRDVQERGRTVESVIDQYLGTVKPMHEKYVEPSKRYAHIVVPEGGENKVALDIITGHILQHAEEI